MDISLCVDMRASTCGRYLSMQVHGHACRHLYLHGYRHVRRHALGCVLRHVAETCLCTCMDMRRDMCVDTAIKAVCRDECACVDMRWPSHISAHMFRHMSACMPLLGQAQLDRHSAEAWSVMGTVPAYIA